MNHKKLSNWGVAAGFLGVILFVLALIVFWSDSLWLGFDHKDFYFAGMGLLVIAIWFKLGAIYHKS